MGSWQLMLLTAGVFLGLFVLERFVPLRRQYCHLGLRLLVNVLISGAALGTAALMVSPLIAWAMGGESTQVGLLHLVALPEPLEIVVGFLLMDLAFYYWHLLNHQLPWLWRFHNVHYIDPDMDVSSAFRFHFGEMVFSAVFRVLQILAIGVSPLTYVVYEAAFLANTMFQHSNVRLPIRLERWLNRVLVTPRTHGIHHSQVKRETNSNYSVVLPWWDHLHRTLRLNVRQSSIEIGVPAYSNPKDNGVWHLLSLPFRRQRDYWRVSEGEAPERREEDTPEHRSKLAE